MEMISFGNSNSERGLGDDCSDLFAVEECVGELVSGSEQCAASEWHASLRLLAHDKSPNHCPIN